MKLNYALEYEFLVKTKAGDIVPAHRFTKNLDGQPFIGELRTGIFRTLTEACFDLMRRIYLESISLNAQGVMICDDIAEFRLSNKDRIDLRRERSLTKDRLIERSIYFKSIGKALPSGFVKSSLQINLSENREFKYTNNNHQLCYSHSDIFDFPQVIKLFDETFAKQIRDAKRVKGVYAIKSGTKGQRIEYRSLPSTIDLEKLMSLDSVIKEMV